MTLVNQPLKYLEITNGYVSPVYFSPEYFSSKERLAAVHSFCSFTSFKMHVCVCNFSEREEFVNLDLIQFQHARIKILMFVVTTPLSFYIKYLGPINFMLRNITLGSVGINIICKIWEDQILYISFFSYKKHVTFTCLFLTLHGQIRRKHTRKF